MHYSGYALWGARASNLTVAGVASVGGDLTVGGQAIAGELVANDEVRANRIFLEGVDNAYGRLFSHFGEWLYMGEADTFGGGLRLEFPMWANQGAAVDGGLVVRGGLTIGDTGLDLADSGLLVNDDAAGATALHWGGTWLRIGEANRFGSGVRVVNPARFDDTVALRSGVEVEGAVNLNTCRICINVETDVGVRSHACTRLVAGSASPMQLTGGGNQGISEYGLVFVCDGGDSVGGLGFVEP